MRLGAGMQHACLISKGTASMIRPILILLACAPLAAMATPANRQVDYPAFQQLTARVSPVRAKRLVSLDQFKAKAKRGAIILDARSANAFAQGHIKGAVNLPFTDFTAESLAATIGDAKRPILIYCNNNFSNHKAPVGLKAAPVALNIQTFINLTGYGYHNVYELADLVDFNEPKVEWIAAETAALTSFGARP
jgi:phage shock protein E